jgi:hypothetical protein
VHEAIFPLNDQPDGLPALLGRFENGNAIYRFIQEHLRCGALVALSFMRAHYPEVDMNLVKMLPLTLSGHVDMDAHYAACKQAADLSQDRSSPKVIVKERIGMFQRLELVACVNICYLLFGEVLRCVVLYRRCIILLAFIELYGRKAEPPSVGQRAEPSSVVE